MVGAQFDTNAEVPAAAVITPGAVAVTESVPANAVMNPAAKKMELLEPVSVTDLTRLKLTLAVERPRASTLYLDKELTR